MRVVEGMRMNWSSYGHSRVVSVCGTYFRTRRVVIDGGACVHVHVCTVVRACVWCFCSGVFVCVLV